MSNHPTQPTTCSCNASITPLFRDYGWQCNQCGRVTENHPTRAELLDVLRELANPSLAMDISALMLASEQFPDATRRAYMEAIVRANRFLQGQPE